MQLTVSKSMHPQRETGPALSHNVVIPSDLAEARRIQEDIEKQLQAACHDHDLFSIKLALEEALVNAVKHGNQYDRSKSVAISYSVLPDRFMIRITDQGEGFDPADVPDPTAIENLERPCGRGLMLMKHYMTEVDYNKEGNSVFMAKVFKINGKK